MFLSYFGTVMPEYKSTTKNKKNIFNTSVGYILSDTLQYNWRIILIFAPIFSNKHSNYIILLALKYLFT
jgi:hypothetical protein